MPKSTASSNRSLRARASGHASPKRKDHPAAKNAPQNAPSAIDPSKLGLYLREMQLQCEAALFAYRAITTSLQQEQDTCFLVFFYAHALLGHMGNLSKLLVPDKKTCKDCPLARQRAEALQRALGVTPDCYVTSRAMRNHFEHFDARLDKAINGKNPWLIDMNIMPPGAVHVHEPREDGFFRNLDPRTLNLSFQGAQLNLRQASRCVRCIMERIRAYLTLPEECGARAPDPLSPTDAPSRADKPISAGRDG